MTTKKKTTSLVFTKERHYGNMGSGNRSFYAVSLRGTQIATADTKELALEAAWRTIQDTLSVQMARVRVAIAADGTVITAREYQAGYAETCHYRPYNNASPEEELYSQGSCMGRIEVDGKSVSLKAYLEHEVKRYNDCIRVAVR